MIPRFQEEEEEQQLLLGTLSIARGQKIIVLKWQDLPDFSFELKIF